MTEQAASLLIARIGLASQLATALLLVLLFSLLYRLAQRKEYFYYWACAWGFISLGLAALFVRFFILDLIPNTDAVYSLDARLTDGVYQFSKLTYLGMLLYGTLNYARGLQSTWLLNSGLVFSVGYAIFTFVVADDLLDVLAWQDPLTVSAYMVCALVLLSLPPSRRTLGSRFTAGVFCAFGLVWLLYLSMLLVPPELQMQGVGLVLWHLMLYNAFLDMLLQILLAFGMVLILMEDAKRETEAAHGELALAHQELREEALRDSLTRALNRRAFNEGAGLEAARAGFGTAMVFDLDNLKQVNDTYGHQAGDALLKYFVEVLRPELRPTDKLYRFGGDEFLLVMPRAHRDNVLERFQRFFAEVMPLSLAEGEVRVKLEVSLGAALYTSGERLDAAVSEADRKMYANKRQHKLFEA